MKRLAGIGGLLGLIWMGACAAAEKIPDFELPDLQGKKVKFSQVVQGKPFVLKFGATWCGWCQRQTPILKKIAEKYGDKAPVIEVDIRETKSKVRKNAERHRINYPVLLDLDGSVARAYRIRGIPVVIVGDRQGRVVYRGYYTESKVLEKQIEKAMKQSQD
jgi:thiol-disulfide isomerase/thioredoxin